MRYTISLWSLIVFALSGCNLLPSGSSAEINALNRAKARWASFDFDRYTIEQTRSCECLPPYSYLVIVDENEVDSLVYDKLSETYGSHPDELYRIAVKNAQTVAEAFDMLEQAHDEAAELRVEYDQQYGYPTEIYIDHHADYVDDEIIWTMSNLTPKK